MRLHSILLHTAFGIGLMVITSLSLSMPVQTANTPIVGLPCEDCEVPLIGMPSNPPSQARIAPVDEPGVVLHLSGTVFDAEGKPRAGVIIYANQTDHAGLYPQAGHASDEGVRRHGRLRAWAMSDAQGRYTFTTIRPGSYPNSDIAEHIHLYVIERGCALYYIDNVEFTDDPKLKAKLERIQPQNRGGSGIVTPVVDNIIWKVERDIILGKNITDYPGCAA